MKAYELYSKPVGQSMIHIEAFSAWKRLSWLSFIYVWAEII